MRNILTVMKFTIKEMIRRKSFIISTVIILAFIIIGFNIPNIIKTFAGEDTGEKILIVDNKNVFEGNLEILKDNFEDYEISFGNDSYDEVKKKIDDGDIDTALIIDKENGNINMKYLVENTFFVDSVPQELITAINSIYSNMQIRKLGLTDEQIVTITPNFEFSIEQTEDEVHGNILLMMLLSLVLFYAIYFCAYQVSSSITTEKTSKIMETLVTSTSPRTIILGKTFGIGIVRSTSNDCNCWNRIF